MAKVEITANDELAATDEQRPTRRSQWRFKAAIIAGAACMMLLAGVLLVALTTGPVAEDNTTDEAKPLDALGMMAIGDNLQMAGKLDQAIAAYKEVTPESASQQSTLSYRMALCAEQVGDFSEARKHYVDAARHDSSEIALASKFGQARVGYLQGDLGQSADALAKMAARSAAPAYSRSTVGADVTYLMAMVATQRVMAQHSATVRDLEHVFSPAPVHSVGKLLQLVPLEGNPVKLSTHVGDETLKGIELHGPALTPSTTLLSAGIYNQQLSSLLDILAAETGWTISPSVAANEIAWAKRVEVRLHEKTAFEMLSWVLEPLGLFWEFDDETVFIDRAENFAAAKREARMRKQAYDLLQNVLAEFPSHGFAPYAFLQLGNLAVSEKKYDQASTSYREINDRFPRHALRQAANYNLGKVQYLTSDLSSAVESFHRAIDLRQGTEVEPWAYLYLGRIQLEHGDLNTAKRSLSRGLAISGQVDSRSTSAVTLAAVYLMLDESWGAAESANSVLMEARQSLQEPNYAPRAIFLSALTRLRATQDPVDVRRRERELTSSLMRVKPTDFFGDFGYLLVGDAFARVGVTQEAMRIYQQGLSRPLSATMRDQMLFRLAVEYRKQQRHLLAENTFLELAAGESPAWAPLAAIELADMLAQIDDWPPCIAHCRWSLEQEYSDGHKAQLLKRMGQAYEELGDHKRASLCYAGFLPPVEVEVPN